MHKGREKKLGGSHHDTLLAAVLAKENIYKSKGKYNEAEGCFPKAWAGWHSWVGPSTLVI